MAEHIYHATATLAELGLAMSIGTITKIFPQPTLTDSLARETTQKRIEETDGKIALFFYKVGCLFTKILGVVSKLLPLIVFLSEMAVLLGMAFIDIDAVILFWLASAGLLVMMFFIFFHKETFRKTGHHPVIEPVE